MGFPSSATPLMEGLVDLHNYICLFLIFILVAVATLILMILQAFFLIQQHPWRWRHVWTDRIDVYYSRKATHGWLKELIWTLIPAGVLYTIALPSFALLYAMEQNTTPSLVIKIIGHQWYWSYEFPHQLIDLDANIKSNSSLIKGEKPYLTVDLPLVLPIHTMINFIVTSQDVLHSFSIPNFGIKIDAVPGRLNSVSAFIKYEGAFYGMCSELCGVNHAAMPITIIATEIVSPCVLPPAKFLKLSKICFTCK